tara:strand:+ start:227 stop:424 length:198 start_codon:yes stop_codon:yes gene_type:complete
MKTHVTIKKSPNQITVYLLTPDRGKYYLALCKYAGDSMKEAKKEAQRTADLYGCKIVYDKSLKLK